MFMFAVSSFLNTNAGNILPIGNTSLQNVSIAAIEEDVDKVRDVVLGWLPLTAILLIAIGYQIGLSPIPWSYTGTVYLTSDIIR